MGLFSGHRRLFRGPELRSPIQFHSTFTMAAAMDRLSTTLRQLPSALLVATNDARVVGVALVLAAVALAVEMAASVIR